ncbi:hypothetical protein ACP70R_011739 [Stipagrostis hirtigluma subsp. patula]
MAGAEAGMVSARAKMAAVLLVLGCAAAVARRRPRGPLAGGGGDAQPRVLARSASEPAAARRRPRGSLAGGARGSSRAPRPSPRAPRLAPLLPHAAAAARRRAPHRPRALRGRLLRALRRAQAPLPPPLLHAVVHLLRPAVAASAAQVRRREIQEDAAM